MTSPLSRRAVLRTGALALAGAIAGCTGGSGDGGDGGDGGGGDGVTVENGRPDFGPWLEGVDGGFRDARDADSVTVLVGAEGNSGHYAFEPAGLWITPGTEVSWKWTGEGGQHDVHAVRGASFGSKYYVDAGVHLSYTFDAPGEIHYQCDPHASLGMRGAVAVGD